MKIGMIGLGKMGANMTERLLKGGHEVVAYDLSADALKQAASPTTMASASGAASARRAFTAARPVAELRRPAVGGWTRRSTAPFV